MLSRPSEHRSRRLSCGTWLISIAIAVAIAAVCYRIAESKGRNGVLWAVLGFFFPIIALIIIFVLSDKSGQRAVG